MFITKKITGFIRQFLLISLLILGSCHYYKTYQIDPISNESLKSVSQFKQNIIIHRANGQAYKLTSWTFENDSLKGVSGLPIYIIHIPSSKSFRKKKAIGEEPQATMHIYTPYHEIKSGKIGFPISIITKIEIHENDVAKSVLISTLMVAGSAASVAVVVASIAATVNLLPNFLAAIGFTCACPQVESIKAQSTQYHGSLFPGAIFKSLKRQDYLILDKVLVDDGNINLKIFNNLPEIEYIDRLQVLEVLHDGYEFLGVDNKNTFVGYNQGATSSEILVDRLNNISHSLSSRDNLVYDFDDTGSQDELNSITLKFDKSNISSNSKLIIRGKQTQWLETVANFSFMKIGKSYNGWVKRKDKASAKKWQKKNEWQGIALNVYLKVNEEWKYVGSHHDVGTLSMRELVMDIDFSEVNSSEIEIKLESAYKIWELDYVGITDDWSTDLEVNSIDIKKVVDQDGNDIYDKIIATDDNYHVQDGQGTFINLVATGPKFESSRIVLQGTGYYHHQRDYTHKADLKFFMQLNSQLGIQDLSRSLDLYHELNVIASNND